MDNSTQFIGTKILRSAVEMSRAEYVKFRGWDMPKDEDPDERVYLVEYEPEPNNKPSVEGYAGYVTMSPKDVFDKHYTRLEVGIHTANFGQAHEVRVQKEAEELYTRLTALQKFMNTVPFSTLVYSDRVLMAQQGKSMMNYLSILNARMESFTTVPFENRHIPMMTYGEATELAKKGRAVARINWNGAGMFAFIEPEYETTVQDIFDWESEVGSSALTNHYVGEFAHHKVEQHAGKGPDSKKVVMRATWKLKTADGSIATWSPSGSDVLGEDWVVVD